MTDLRKKILVRILAGDRPCDIARRFEVHRNTVTNVKKLYDETGSVEARPRTGGPRTVRTKEKLEEIRAAIEDNPSTSVRSLSRRFNMAETTTRLAVKRDLGLKSLSKQKVQTLTPQQREKRVERGKKVETFLKRGRDGKVLVFSDEKDFTVDQHLNRRNDRYIAKSTKDAAPELRYVGASKHPAKASMLGVIMSDGNKLPPIWYEGSMDGPKYKNFLVRRVFPVLDATYGKNNYIWTQDGAPAHTCNAVQKYLTNKLGSSGFWSKDLWPPSSPNLNPLDFSIWTHVEREACATPHSNVAELKAAVEASWASMTKDYIADCCACFRRRVRAAIESEGGAFEK